MFLNLGLIKTFLHLCPFASVCISRQFIRSLFLQLSLSSLCIVADPSPDLNSEYQADLFGFSHLRNHHRSNALGFNGNVVKIIH